MTDAAANLPRPHIRIRPTATWALNLGELWRFRELLFTIAARDVKVRYKQTALGAIWVVIQPLMAAGIFTFIFGKVADFPMDGVPYFIGSFAGFQAWGLFNNTIGKSGNCLVGNTNLISKIYFPRLVIPAATVPTTLIDFAVAMVLLAVLMIGAGVFSGWQLVLLPLWMAGLLTIAMGIGLAAAALAVPYRDVRYVLPVMVQMLLYVSPVGYTVAGLRERLPESPWLIDLYLLNPLAPLIEGFRWSLLGTTPPPLLPTLWAFVASLLVLTAGTFCFIRMERRFADII